MGRLSAQAMGAGFSAGQAIAIGGTQKNTISAAGTTQATATVLNAGSNRVSTVASGAGVKLPSTQPGDECDVYNAGANGLIVYPPTGAKINSGATNAGVTIGTQTFCRFVYFSSTQIFGLVSA